ncbi:hypothetical protein [Lacipirellula limnantheis]|uniref:Uncharacterized protein n=1 Tax=Lacipirellula limnantheis TaxID=2528024 RepID=A0A517TYD3_9BACT|nr:hypothetical protein [Lacipirellula limnantheis]QDT73388.1 hypothetical protein I41_25770 [Lacipirellula limnantheis]
MPYRRGCFLKITAIPSSPATTAMPTIAERSVKRRRSLRAATPPRAAPNLTMYLCG